MILQNRPILAVTRQGVATLALTWQHPKSRLPRLYVPIRDDRSREIRGSKVISNISLWPRSRYGMRFGQYNPVLTERRINHASIKREIGRNLRRVLFIP
jgi:hypothetical protein